MSEPHGKEVVFGISRTRVVPNPEGAPLDFYIQRIDYASDAIRVTLPDGEFINSIWLMYDGLEMARIPLEPGGLFFYRPEWQQRYFAQWMSAMRYVRTRRKRRR